MPSRKKPVQPTATRQGVGQARSERSAAVQERFGNQRMQHALAPPVSAAAHAGRLPAVVSRALATQGAALPPGLRNSAQACFGADLDSVRVHTGAAATDASRALEARAFSVGRNIVLAEPHAVTDMRLMGHEIAHVLQAPATGSSAVVAHPGATAEREAHAAGAQFATGQAVHAGGSLVAPCTAHIHRDPLHPSATVIDADYLLYALDHTDYDNTTLHYYLSPWDRAHLVRRHGLYALEDTPTGTYLIAPPEVRRAAGGVDALVPLLPADEAAWAAGGRAGAAQFVIDAAQRILGVTVSAVTLPSGADEDFSRPKLPAAVGRALAAPLQGVTPAMAQGVNAARTRAAHVTQQRTLSLATTRREELPTRAFTSADQMDVNTLFSRDDAGRATWYVDKLGTLQAQLAESAAAHHLPMQLLAVVVLNELADFNGLDVYQNKPSTYGGSVGIAQIQISTAQANGLVDLPSNASETGWARSGSTKPRFKSPAELAKKGRQMRISQLLQVPQVAIEAAAREIESLIKRMAAHLTQPWQQAHYFTATGPQGDAIYKHVGTGDQQSREGALAEVVCGAYNSPDIIAAPDTSGFRNASVHGANANELAQDLYRFRLFRTS